MHRRRLLESLAEYAVRDSNQRMEVARFVRFVNANPDCFDRRLRHGHLTASACVVDCDRKRLLLVHHRKLGRWLQPGGHADGDPDLLAVARREVLEETGVDTLPVTDLIFDVDRHRIPGNRSEPAHWHYDVRFLLQATGPAPVQGNQEVNEVRWFATSRVAAMKEQSVARLAHKLRSGTPDLTLSRPTR